MNWGCLKHWDMDCIVPWLSRDRHSRNKFKLYPSLWPYSLTQCVGIYNLRSSMWRSLDGTQSHCDDVGHIRCHFYLDIDIVLDLNFALEYSIAHSISHTHSISTCGAETSARINYISHCIGWPGLSRPQGGDGWRWRPWQRWDDRFSRFTRTSG